MSILGYGIYPEKDIQLLQDQYQKAQESLGKCRKELIELRTQTTPLLRENSSLCQKVYDLNRDNNQLQNNIKEITNQFNTKRERETTAIEKGLIIELDLKKAELYNLKTELRDSKSIIDHITGIEGTNFYINDMIKFIKEKQQQETLK